jgi:putative ABC transport system permease protein
MSAMLTDLLVRLRAILRRDAVERELDEELRFHVEHQIDRHVESGLSRADAVRRAHLEFGGVERMKEACRDARGVGAIESLLQDLRHGARTMRRSPVFSVTAILTIALSTAALATVFTLGQALFLRMLPVDRPDELVTVSATRGGPRSEGLVSYPDYTAFRDRATTVSRLAAIYPTAPLFVTVNGNAREINGAVVSANFLPMLGVTPALGRFFRDDEDQVPDRDRVAVIGDSLWRNTFAASPDAIGATLRINGVDFTVIGVTPPSLVSFRSYPLEIYLPTMMLRVGYRWCDDSLAASCTILEMMGRLAPGRTLADAAAEMPTLMPASWAHAPTGENSGVAVTGLRGPSTDEEEPRLVRILAGVAVVLLLAACANLAGLLSAQSTARAGEFGIRLSLGAEAGRIIRQVMTESLMLAFAGGVAGVALSRVFIGALGAMFYTIDGEGHPVSYDFSLTPMVVLAAMVVALMAGCLFSVIPAIAVVRRPDRAVHGERSGTARWSSGAWLLGAQAAVAVALVAVTGLMTASAQTMLAGTNFEASHVALMRLRPRLVKYTPERAQRFQRDVIQRLEATSGVESVSLVGTGAVLGGGAASVALPDWTPGQPLRAAYNEIGPKYFATLRTPLVSGREFDRRDTIGSPRVAIVNQTLAERLWPAGQAIGAAILVTTVPHQVVGVVSDVPLHGRTEARQPWVFVPFWQTPGAIDSRLAIRVAGDPAAMLPELVRQVNRVDPDVPIAEAITLPIRLAGLMRPLRVSATFIGYAAAVAVGLTAIGLYGTLAFAVSRRTKEIGIRMALGAARGRVLGLVLRQGMTVVIAGAMAGLALAAAGTRIVVHLLYRPATADWMFYAAAAVLVLVVGFCASLLPARRAAAVEPLVALRHD